MTYVEKEKGLIKSVKIKRVRVKSVVASNSDYKLDNPSRKQFSTQAFHFSAYQSPYAQLANRRQSA